jgi:type 1 fimbria pilin
MGKFIALLMGVLLLASMAVAGQAAGGSETVTLNGVVVDNACASGHKTDLGEFVKTHTKDCALMPGCEASGYSLVTPDGQAQMFTKTGSQKVAKFLKTKKGTLKVEVKVKKIGKELELISIKNQA